MNKYLFKFRRYKKKEGDKNVRHTKLIVDETIDEYGYMGLTESKMDGHHHNIKLAINPKKGDTRDSYLRKRIQYDKKNRFSEILSNYNLSDFDKTNVEKYVIMHKKKK